MNEKLCEKTRYQVTFREMSPELFFLTFLYSIGNLIDAIFFLIYLNLLKYISRMRYNFSKVFSILSRIPAGLHDIRDNLIHFRIRLTYL